MKRWSLKRRLILYFSLLLITVWLASALLSWIEGRKFMNEFFDTQQMLFAKRLASANLTSLTRRLPESKDMLRGTPKHQRGEEEDDALGFAVFDSHGTLVLSDGENGDDFIFTSDSRGFVNGPIDDSDDEWRIVWVPSLDGKYLVAVGQELDFRRDIVFEMTFQQLAPWLYSLPLLLPGMLWLVSRALAPLRQVQQDLEARRPGDTTTIEALQAPDEVRPLINALNSLFGRMASLLARERAFISDAAHELRTPLSALRVQAEVAAMADDEPAVQKKALTSLIGGIDRSNRLVEQLLTLSRLEAIQAGGTVKTTPGLETAALDWPALIADALTEYRPAMEKKNLRVNVALEPSLPARQGYPGLVAVLLRNLVNNAVSYTEPEGWITIRSERDKHGLCSLVIANSGPGVSPDLLPRLTERFFRPPGQEQPGSGLGLAIAGRVVELHAMRLTITSKNGGENQPGKDEGKNDGNDAGFSVGLTPL